jgi:hypothetical protein
MRHTLQLILAVALAVVSYAYFAWVLPSVVAALIGFAILVITLHAMISGQFRLPLFGGPVLLAWPAGAVLASLAVDHVFAGELSRDRALAVSWILPLMAWKLSYAISQRRDQARDLGGMAIAVIVAYVSVAALLSGDLMALMLASLGAGAVAFVAHQHLILPPDLEVYLLRLGGAGWGAALLFGVRLLWA